MDVGVVVKVKGRVGEFREQKQVEVIKVDVLGCTDEEVRCWNEVMDFRRDVLGKVWVVSKEQEEKCRRVRERELRSIGKGKRVEKDKGEKRREETGEARRKKTEMERKEDYARRKEREGILKASNKVNHPSLAARTAAGKI
jgi:endo-1,3(4)-beta-glucanase